jgi:uncharacterized protein (DUF1800 family)
MGRAPYDSANAGGKWRGGQPQTRLMRCVRQVSAAGHVSRRLEINHMSLDSSPAIAANRFGLGARPGDLQSISADPRGWLSAQLHGPAPLIASPGLRGTAEVLREAGELARERREQKRSGDDETGANPPLAALKRLPQLFRPVYLAELQARMRQALDTPAPFVERLVYFWSNHFAVSVDKIAVTGIAGSLEREAIRPYVLGNFRQLLLAVEQHPAMLLYLDNQRSTGANSLAAQRAARFDRKLGLNENLAREIMELHTLGVDGGYTQADVTAFAKVLTGWSIGGGFFNAQPGVAGEFMFRPQQHEPGVQTLRGRRYLQSDVMQGVAVLTDLARDPATARHVATKLARHFISDDPPPRAIAQIAQVFERSGGDLPRVYQAVIDCREAWDSAQTKYKTPQDYVLSVYRGLQLPVNGRADALLPFDALGQRTFAPGSPAGWPDRSADWDGASALMKRIEYADTLAQSLGTLAPAVDLAPQLLGDTYSDATRVSLTRAANPAQAMTLLLTSPEFMRR